MKALGFMVLIGIACFWIGRLTGKPEAIEKIKIVKEEVYTSPAYLQALCATLYPCPALDSKKAGQ